MTSVLDAVLNIAFGSHADRRLNPAFVEAELDVMAIIRDRQSGSTRPTPALPTGESRRTEDAPRLEQRNAEAPTPEQILAGWKKDLT